MRTTIALDDDLLDDLKKRATAKGTTVSRLIEDAVRFAAPSGLHAEQLPAFELITFGKGGRFTALDVDKVSALLEREDIARYGRRP